ncbi:hypothetical protein GCM10011506_00830 [Marivirga lumbricoides]|uniref:Uncharacterized protein n=2 Tax=Marivirga lumbricoides TaxID=1046115 RepID=A0ABQ1LA10_9BACT|nr:hypothetical protein GCM10011506_00830 [Marivirga lumbricoides]
MLTIITQVGGVLYFLTLLTAKAFKLNQLKGLAMFGVLYLITSFAILPAMAPVFGRTALPFTGNLKPLNFGTCLLNRHYVTPELKYQLVEIADEMNKQFAGSVTHYLDGNFPFFNGFPLIPHLSHNDGKKLDLAFFYTKKDGSINSAPGFIGYGIYESPAEGEVDYPARCREQGYWQYGILSSFVINLGNGDYQLDVDRTRTLIKLMAEHRLTSKIFIEPHLKQRWELDQYKNIRFQGCRAVRHDDHIHTQVR